MALEIPVNGLTQSFNIRQQPDDTIEYSLNYGYTWDLISMWPIRIINTTPSLSMASMVKVMFTTDITFTNIQQYFICGSSHIQFGSHRLNANGTRPKITISSVSGYGGLIQNGTTTVNGYNSIFVFNLELLSTGSSLSTNGGWIGRTYFSKGASNDKIINCYSNGNTTNHCGGIIGARTADSGGSITIIGCNSVGSIGQNGGGIVGSYSGLTGGSITITKCFSTGAISQFGGGIAGAHSQNISSTKCYSTGTIGHYGGGIQGINPSSSIATNCYSRGNIFGAGSGAGGGGIFGDSAGNTGITQAINCYSTGIINLGAGGIFGSRQNTTNAIAINCYTTGTGGYPNTSGIFAVSSFDNPTGSSGNFSHINNLIPPGWNDIRARSTLTGVPSSGKKVGTGWISTGTNVAYEIRDMGYNPYLLDIIDTETYTLITRTTSRFISGNSTIDYIISNASSFQLLSINDSVPEGYSSISINTTTGRITTEEPLQVNTYTIVLRFLKDGRYMLADYILYIIARPSPVFSLRNTKRLSSHTTLSNIITGNTLFEDRVTNQKLKYKRYSSYEEYQIYKRHIKGSKLDKEKTG